MKCSKCNAEIAENAKFCPICGAKVEPESKCPNCGAPISKDAKFCTKCGCRIERNLKCPECGTEISEEDKFCTKCGAKIGDDSCNNNQQYVTINNNIDSQQKTQQMSEPPLSPQVASEENNVLPREEVREVAVVPPPAEPTDSVPILNNDDSSFDVVAYRSVISNIYKKAICVITVLWGVSVVFSIIPYIKFISTITSLVWFGFYIYYIVCLGRLVKAAHKNDVPAIKKLLLSSIIIASLPVVAIVSALILSIVMSSVGLYDFSIFDAIGIIFFIILAVFIISAIALRIISFEKLRKSETFIGRQGAKTLFIATIIYASSLLLTIISALIGIIGIAIYLIMAVSLVAIIFTFIGWKKIKEAAELECPNGNTGIGSNETIVCPNKTCGKEVSAQFDECPFCGTSLRSQE